MKLALMQPYFFPYLGYFDIIKCVDKWIVFDTVQYIRRGWIHRNRILHAKEGWQYIVVPVKQHAHKNVIKDIMIANEQNWKRRIIGKLQHYNKKAPYFHQTIAFVEDCLAIQENSISRLNVSILDKVCARLGIHFDYSFFSEMDLELGPVEEPGDWGLRVSELMGAGEYVNPSGGTRLFNEQKFRDNNIRLTIRNLPPFEYPCIGYEFIPNLSIIDLFMWNKPETIKQHLDNEFVNVPMLSKGIGP
ncbi:MAG: WbqC family protein [Candidatus Hodarchaeota archaeon]